jgi:hypothetical protein
MPVAEVIPYTKDKSETLADRIANLVSSGSIAPRKEPFRLNVLENRPGAVKRFLQQDRE